MKLLSVVSLIPFLVATCDSVTAPSVRCQSGMYYDTALERCDFCDAICDFAQIQGTVNDCLSNCPDFKSKKMTPMQNRQETTTSASPSKCDAERETITILIITLCGVSSLLIGLMGFVILMAFRGIHSKKTTRGRCIQPPPPLPLLMEGSHNRTRPNSQYQKNFDSGIHGTERQPMTTNK